MLQLPLPDPTKPLDEQEPVTLLSSLILCEAANQTDIAKLGMACVVRNRWQRRLGFGNTWTGVMLQPNAFSVTNPRSIVYRKLLNPLKYETYETWRRCYLIAATVYYGLEIPDPSLGAHFYFSRPVTEPPKDWGEVLHTVTIDDLHFYRIAPNVESKAA